MTKLDERWLSNSMTVDDDELEAAVRSWLAMTDFDSILLQDLHRLKNIICVINVINVINVDVICKEPRTSSVGLIALTNFESLKN